MPLNRKSTRRARVIERTRHDIVEAAARVFAGAGYHGATMQAIAREAGFTAASLYTYFRSKDEIHAALIEEINRALLATFDAPVPTGLSFPQRLELLVQRQMELITARRSALRVVFDPGPGKLQQHHGGPQEYLRKLEAFLEEAGHGRLRAPPAEAALILYGLGHSMVLPFLLGEERSSAPDAARVVDVFLHGVGRTDLR